MARTVNIHEAKTNLSKLIEAVEAGEEIIIARAGEPCVTLALVKKPPRQFGQLEGLHPAADRAAVLEPILDNDDLDAWEASIGSPPPPRQ